MGCSEGPGTAGSNDPTSASGGDASVGNDAAQTKRLILLNNTNSPFWDTCREGMNEAVRDMNLAELGYACVLYPVTLLRVAMKAMESALAVISMDGHQQSVTDLMQTREELYELLDYEP